jgi:DnaJ-class molecular chaperone
MTAASEEEGVPCPTCHGTGSSGVTCTVCDGRGRVMGVGCWGCKGTGKKPCATCHGVGTVKKPERG